MNQLSSSGGTLQKLFYSKRFSRTRDIKERVVLTLWELFCSNRFSSTSDINKIVILILWESFRLFESRESLTNKQFISDLNTLFLEMSNSLQEDLNVMQCAIKTRESFLSTDLAQQATAFKFSNNSCTLGKTPNYHDGFLRKTTNEDSAVYVAMNTKPIGKS